MSVRHITRTAFGQAIAKGISAAIHHEAPITGEQIVALVEYAMTAPAATVGDYYPQDPESSDSLGCPWHAAGLNWSGAASPDLAFATAFDARIREVLALDTRDVFDLRIVD